MPKNRRKRKHYIEFRGLRWSVPGREWGDYLRRGLTVIAEGAVAVLREGVEIVFEGGVHHVRDLDRGERWTIPSTWRLAERQAIYSDTYIVDPGRRQRQIWSDYGGARRGWEIA
jgi:hypothetical protein